MIIEETKTTLQILSIVAFVVAFTTCGSLYQARAESSAASERYQWRANWIGASNHSQGAVRTHGASDEKNSRMPIFRKDFVARKAVAGATLRISGLGQYEVHINKHNVTDAVLTPGWTDYRKRILYNTYDVTGLLVSGRNAIGVMLGSGMYDVREAKGRYSKFSGSFGSPKLIAELDIRYVDDTHQVVASDDTWETTPGPITFSSVYGGEDYDARLEQPGWDGPAFGTRSWSHVEVVDGPGGALEPELISPVKEFERFDPIAVTHPAPNMTVYDLGQNFSGWPEIEVSGRRGSQVKLIAGELLDARGFVTQHSANASPGDENSFSYVLNGRRVERWHPRFSYWGFRYIQVNSSSVTIHSIDGRFIHDAVPVSGSFSSSSELFSRIHRLIDMAMLSNMVSVLTDCPHREKLGWLEQTHLAGASLMYNYDLSTLYAKIANDMQDAQLPSGLVPDIAPEFPVFDGAFRDSPEWGIADILSTWAAYQFYGDLEQLREHYGSMARYMAYLRGKSQNHIIAYGLGDWYDIGPGDPGPSKLTAKGLTATAVYYQALTKMARIAVLSGHDEDAQGYEQEAAQVRLAFNQQYFHPDTNQYDTGSQTANAMPLVVGLVLEDRREAVLENLVKDIRAHSNHVTAGDVGYHYVVRALTDGNRSDVLFDMLSRADKPSYADQLAHGATTLTEAWDANPNSSQNHFMLGHAEEWFYRGLAGIDFDLDRSAETQIIIHPAVVGDIRDAKASFQSKLGKIESEWVLAGDELRMTVLIPKGAMATIVFPAGFDRDLRVNGMSIEAAGEIRNLKISAGEARCVVLGGRFVFSAKRLSSNLGD
jgi:alpha-L-rhamnosidase